MTIHFAVYVGITSAQQPRQTHQQNIYHKIPIAGASCSNNMYRLHNQRSESRPFVVIVLFHSTRDLHNAAYADISHRQHINNAASRSHTRSTTYI